MSAYKLKLADGYTVDDLPIIPVGYRLLIKQLLKSVKSDGGIFLGGVAEENRQQKGYHFGEVVAVGPEAYDKSPTPWCKAGDIVRFKPYQGAEMKDPNDKHEDGTHWHIMNDIDILGVIPNKDKV